MGEEWESVLGCGGGEVSGMWGSRLMREVWNSDSVWGECGDCGEVGENVLG